MVASVLPVYSRLRIYTSFDSKPNPSRIKHIKLIFCFVTYSVIFSYHLHLARDCSEPSTYMEITFSWPFAVESTLHFTSLSRWVSRFTAIIAARIYEISFLKQHSYYYFKIEFPWCFALSVNYFQYYWRNLFSFPSETTKSLPNHQ